MTLLKKGRVLVSDVTERRYRVASGMIAEGGFGEVYRGEAIDRFHDVEGEVAIKVSLHQDSWHREAYFGRLLGGQSRVVPLQDAFPVPDGVGRARQTKYLLVFDWMHEGTVTDRLDAGLRWSEATIVREIRGLLGVLALMHGRGICHGDVTPNNVFIADKRLLLGDLGIATQALEARPVVLDAAAPPIFFPPDASPSKWTPADDVYQVGLLALCLLSGQLITSYDVCGRVLRGLQASDAVKGWIHSALTDRTERYRDAAEARDCLGRGPIKSARAPRSLRSQVVVFTGILPMKRSVAITRARRAGATVQTHVTAQTTMVVQGDGNPLMIGEDHGKKLFDAQRRIGRGQNISIVSARRFEQLLSRK